MAGGATRAAQPGLGAAARFALGSLELRDGVLIVTGTWSEVRGLRFVRPTLLHDGRHVLANLDQKPWDPAAQPWVASFPWLGPEPDPSEVRLSVAPSITVDLATGTSGLRFTREPNTAAPELSRPDETKRLTAERDAALTWRDEAQAERDQLRAELDEAIGQVAAAEAERDALRAERDEAMRAKATADAELHRLRAGFDDAARREAAAQAELDVMRIDVTEARQSADRAARTADEAQARADTAQRDAIAARQDRDDARAALTRPAQPEERVDYHPFTTTRGTLEPTGRQLWGARAVIIVATIVAIIILIKVLGPGPV